MTLLLVEARMTSRFSLPRSDSATFNVPPVLAAALAGALACDVPWVGLVAAVDAGVGPAPRQAATRATAPLAASSRNAVRRVILRLGRNSSRSMKTAPPFRYCAGSQVGFRKAFPAMDNDEAGML